MPSDDPITRRELDAIRELMEVRFAGVQRALEVATHEAEKKYEELSEVRARFIGREVFESYKSEMERKAREHEEKSTQLFRGTMVVFCTFGFTLLGLIVAVVRNFMVGK